MPLLYVASFISGGYCGSIFFYMVFHSLAHPERNARRLAINESVIGLSVMIGPFLAGSIAERISVTAWHKWII
jgi:hypothetical protein